MPVTDSDNEGIVRFGQFAISHREKQLFRGDEKIVLPVKAIELLSLLIENRGRIVSKDEILSTIWTDTFVDENNLAVLVSNLRKALGEKKSEKKFIETVPRRGYRFVHEVDENPDADERNASAVVVGHPVSVSSGFLRRKLPILAAAVVLLTLFAFAFSARIGRDGGTKFGSGSSRLTFETPSTPSVWKSVLVMPHRFAGKQDVSFERDFTEGIIFRLGSLNRFNVRPFFTVATEELRSRLGSSAATEHADFVLEGTVEALPDGRFRVESSLLDVTTRARIWSERLEDSSLTLVKERIAGKSAEAIQATLSPQERDQLARRRATNLAAYGMYSRGLERFRTRSDGSINYFQEAVSLDPEFSQAWAMLACVRAFDGWKGSPAALEAKNYLEKALTAPDPSADAFAAQGFVKLFHEYDWTGAEAALRKALEIDPYNVNARLWLGWHFAIHRRVDEAIAEVKKGLELDPVNPVLLSDLGLFHSYSGRPDLAADLGRRAAEIDPEHYFASGAVLDDKPDDEELLKDVELKASGGRPSFNLGLINIDPRYERLRSEPRFQSVLKKIGLLE